MISTTPTAPSPPALRALLAGVIDYAGLFPPAQLDMAPAAANYLAYRESREAWALGRFVLPVARLGELHEVLGSAHPPGQPVSVSVLIAADSSADASAIEAFHRRKCKLIRIEAVEARAAGAGDVPTALFGISPTCARYVEVPLSEGLDAALDAIAAAGAFAKVRAGGVTPDAFPSPDSLVGFVAAAARRRLPFKATAGLHHPWGGSYRLTYDADARFGTMYGFLNLALAAAILWGGGDEPRAHAALLEADARAVTWEDTALVWRGERFDAAFLAGMRQDSFHGFGSCSFREPLDELAIGVAG